MKSLFLNLPPSVSHVTTSTTDYRGKCVLTYRFKDFLFYFYLEFLFISALLIYTVYCKIFTHRFFKRYIAIAKYEHTCSIIENSEFSKYSVKEDLDNMEC